MDLETTNKISEIIENEIKSDTKNINIYLEHRTSPKEYWDRLRFILSIIWIILVVLFVLFVSCMSYFSSFVLH